MTEDSEIAQKKRRTGSNPDDIKTADFFVETKKFKSSEDYFVLQC